MPGFTTTNNAIYNGRLVSTSITPLPPEELRSNLAKSTEGLKTGFLNGQPLLDDKSFAETFQDTALATTGVKRENNGTFVTLQDTKGGSTVKVTLRSTKTHVDGYSTFTVDKSDMSTLKELLAGNIDAALSKLGLQRDLINNKNQLTSTDGKNNDNVKNITKAEQSQFESWQKWQQKSEKYQTAQKNLSDLKLGDLNSLKASGIGLLINRKDPSQMKVFVGEKFIQMKVDDFLKNTALHEKIRAVTTATTGADKKAAQDQLEALLIPKKPAFSVAPALTL
jgi:hypothetical protein